MNLRILSIPLLLLAGTSAQALTTLIDNPSTNPSDPYTIAGNPFRDIVLTGTTTRDVWDDMRNGGAGMTGYPGFPGSSAWPSEILSQSYTGYSDIATRAALNKVSNGTGGGPYPASSSFYYGGFSGQINNDGGTLAVKVDDPLNPVLGTAVQTVAFQLQIGGAWGYDFLDDELPILTYQDSTGASHTLDASRTSWELVEATYNGTIPMPSGLEDIYVNTYGVQFDLGLLDVASYEVQFTGVQHAQLYGIQLDQSGDRYAVGDVFFTIPEPSTSVLFCLGLAGLAGARRRSQPSMN